MGRSRVELVAAIVALPLATVFSFVLPGLVADPQNPAVLRATTRLVVVNVLVHDKKGAPVRGLKRDDFTILDGGKQEKIATLSVESRDHAATPPRPLPPDTYSNRVARQGNVPANVTVVLLDRKGTAFTDRAYARQHVIKFLSQLQPQDRVALYVLGRQLWVVQDFTSDPGLLLEALRREQRHGPTVPDANDLVVVPPSPSPVAPGRDSSIADRFATGIDILTGERDVMAESLSAGTFSALEAIANHLSGMPGRKSIVWVTGSVPNVTPYLPPASQQKYRHMIQALNQADVAVYPVDARGLFVDPSFEATQADPGPGISSLHELNTQIIAMNFLAHETGGLAFCNTNDLKGAMRVALDESEVTYTLSYYPSHDQWNGEYRPIKVLVDRKGVEVLHRRGYLAKSDTPAGKSVDAVALMKTQAYSPLNATGLGVTVRLGAQPASPSRARKLTVFVDKDGVSFQPSGGGWEFSIDVWAGQYSNQGDSLGGFVKTVSGKLKSNDYQKIQQAGRFSLTMESTADPKAEELRVLVRDASSGLMGSVRVPLRASPQLPPG